MRKISHKCPHCGKKSFVYEVTGPELAELNRAAKKKPEKVVRFREPRAVSRRVRNLILRGCDVPKSLESDWKLLKDKGLGNEEAANALKLPFFKEEDILR